jgi:aminoglycoside phosphotransferase (APT) family kinase protein
MQPIIAQPNAIALSDDVVHAVVRALAPQAAGSPIRTVHADVHSNDLVTARLADGRALMIKRGRHPWSAHRFATSRRAAALLRTTGIATPAYLTPPEGVCEDPLEVYWRIERPVLDEVWPALDEAARRETMRSLGEMARRVHRELPGFGPLEAMDGESPAAIAEQDLRDRLLPAAWGEWLEGAALIERLLEHIPELARRTRGRRPTLVHNDLHMGNVLCEVEDGRARCVGLLDLEAVAAGVPESDFAMMQILHGPHFSRHVPGDWFAEVRRGYAGELDPWVLGFFRALHLLNLGFYSAHIGHDWHAGEVAREAEREVEGLTGTAERPLRRSG